MQGLRRKHWWNSVPLAVIFSILSIGQKVNAQNTFFYAEHTSNGIDGSDIVEDDKDGYFAILLGKLVRINANGRLLWEVKRNGPVYAHNVKDSGYYLLPGVSTEMGGYAMYAYDYRGKQLWMKLKYPSDHKDTANAVYDYVVDKARKQLVLAGDQGTVGSSKHEYWIAGADYRGNILWEKHWYDTGYDSRYFSRILSNQKAGGYTLVTDDEQLSRRHELFNVDSVGNFISREPIEPSPCADFPALSDYSLLGIASFNDTAFIASIAVKTFCNPNPDDDGSYYYIYNYAGKLLTRIRHVWASSKCAQTIDRGIILWGGNFIAKLDSKLNFSWSNELFPVDMQNDYIFIKKLYQAKDGGYYGLADGYKFTGKPPPDNYEYWVYIFKTDSLGRIAEQAEYSEKKQSVMLQPNPSHGQVRVVIPYYHGVIETSVYDVHGRLIKTYIHDEKSILDIQSLKSGIYTVHSKIAETGEMRNMKLVVN